MVTFFREVPGSGGRIYFSDAPQASDVKNIFSPAGIKTIISLDKTAGSSIIKECPRYGIKQYFYHINPADPVPGGSRLAKDIKNLTVNTPVLIHCLHGQDRTGFGIALWLEKVLGYQPCQAIKYVQVLTGFGLGISPKAKDQLKAIVGCIETDTNLADDDIVSQMRDELAHGQGYSAAGTVDGGIFADHLSFAPYSDPAVSYPYSNNIRARVNLLNRIKLAGKKEDIIAKYPDLDLTYLIQRDPSGNLKYLEWEAKVLKSGKAMAREIADVVELFHKFGSDLDKKDLYQYSIDEFTILRDKLFRIRDDKLEKKEQHEAKMEQVSCGNKIVHDSDNFNVRLITNKEASMHYGLGTKWCITMRDATYFEDYNMNNVIFFFIFCKKLGKDNPFYKIAAVFQRDDKNNIVGTEYFDATDDQYNSLEEMINNGLGGIHSYDEDAEAELYNIESSIKQIALDQPKSLTSKISSGEGTDEDFRKFYYIAINTEDAELYQEYLEIMFRQDNIPEDLLEDMVNNEQNIEYVINYKDCPKSILEQLFEELKDKKNDWNENFEYLSKNTALSIDVLLDALDDKEIMKDRSGIIFTAIEERAELGNQEDLKKIFYKIENIKISNDHYYNFIDNLVTILSRNPNCPAEILDNIFESSQLEFDFDNKITIKNMIDRNIIHQALLNPNTSNDTLKKIYNRYNFKNLPPEYIKEKYPRLYNVIFSKSARIKILDKILKISKKKKEKSEDKNNNDFDDVPAGMPGSQHASSGVDEKLPEQIKLPENGVKSNYTGLSENYMNAPSGSPGAPNGASPSQPSGLVQL